MRISCEFGRSVLYCIQSKHGVKITVYNFYGKLRRLLINKKMTR